MAKKKENEICKTCYIKDICNKKHCQLINKNEE